jgi:hypothetical protein
MSATEPKPLDQDLREALEVERVAVFAPEDAKARVLSRLAATVGGLPGDGTGGGHEPAEPKTSAPKPSTGTLARVRLLAHPLSLAVSFTLGSVAGILVWRAAQAPPSPSIVYVDRARPIAPPAPLAGDAVVAAPAASVPPVVSTPAASNAPLVSSLANERVLLDVARLAFGRGDGDGALAALGRHEKLYPAGQLAEEREALAVRALVLTNRGDQARARAARFRKRYPASVMLPAVEAALGTLPN